METRAKTFDCVEMKRRGAARIHEATKGLTLEQKVERKGDILLFGKSKTPIQAMERPMNVQRIPQTDSIRESINGTGLVSGRQYSTCLRSRALLPSQGRKVQLPNHLHGKIEMAPVIFQGNETILHVELPGSVVDGVDLDRSNAYLLRDVVGPP